MVVLGRSGDDHQDDRSRNHQKHASDPELEVASPGVADVMVWVADVTVDDKHDKRSFLHLA
jgi:hypothetical protein